MTGDADVTQAQALIAALRQQLAEMSARLDTMRAGDGTQHSAHRIGAMRHEVDELFIDMNRAQFLIERLQRRCHLMAEATA